MAVFMVYDEQCRVKITADTAQEAAEEFLNWLENEPDHETRRASCTVAHYGDLWGAGEIHTIQLDPTEPPCIDDDGHAWTAPYDIVGGLPENPGVFGRGAGVRIHKICSRCGQHHFIDTSAEDVSSGERYTQEWYLPADSDHPWA
jgi:hypothetical protein